MPLLVVPVAPNEAGLLTIDEWDALVARRPVIFDLIDHPLIERLRAAGVDAGPLDDEPSAQHEGAAFVCDPRSPRLVVLAREGADFLGPGSTVDALTAVRGAPIARRAGRAAAELASLMARLRGPEGCPWDLEQTHATLKPHLLEEAYEVIDAIEHDRLDEDLQEELGDLLLQVAFHAQLASDDGRFDLAAVAERISAKLLHRHPHVFSDTVVSGAQQVVANWEAIKTAEKKRTGPFEDIPVALPALTAAHKTQKRASALGFDPTASEARALAAEALAAADVGEVLFWVVALARSAGIDPEGALREATVRFQERLEA